MKIAVNTLSIRPGKVGGGETYLYNLLDSMLRQRDGDEIALVCSGDNRQAFEERFGEAVIYEAPVLSASRFRRVLFEQRGLAKFLRQINADVLFCPGNTGIPRPPCPMVVVVQSLLTHLLPDEAGKLRSYYFRKSLKRSVRDAAKIIAVSGDIADELAKIEPEAPAKTIAIHEGFDQDYVKMTDEPAVDTVLAKYDVERPFLLFVSSFKPYKNPDKTIRVLGRVKRKLRSNHKLVLVGRDLGNMRPMLEAIAEEEGVKGDVLYTGPVPREELRAFYTAADVFLFPSALESFGFPPLEAFACETPVVAGNKSAVGEIVGDGGIRLDPEDVDGMADAVCQLLTDQQYTQQMIERGKKRVKDFDWTRAGLETLQVLREAAKQ